MMITRSLTRSITRDISRGLALFKQDTLALIQRYLPTFNPILSTHGTITSTIMPSGDFELEFKLVTTDTGTQDLISGATRGNNEIVVDLHASTGLRFFSYTGSTLNPVLSGVVTHSDGKENTVKCSYINGVAYLYFNGILLDSDNWSLVGTETIKYLGKRLASTNYLEGILSDVKFTDKSGQEDAVTEFKLDKAPAEDLYTYGGELPSLVSIGSETVVNDNTVTITNLSAWSFATMNDSYVEAGKAYEVTISNYNSPTGVRIRDSVNVENIENITTDGVYLFTPTDNSLWIQVYTNEFTGSFDISIKEITNYDTVQAEQDIEYAVGTTFDSDIVVNGDFANGLADWEVTEGGQTVEVVDGRLHVITDGTSCGVKQTNGLPNVPVEITVDYTHVSGSLKIQVGSKSFVLNATGRYVFAHIAINSNIYCYRNSGAGEGYFDNFSIREIQGNAITWFGLPSNARELFQFNDPVWTNISPEPQQLPTTIEVAS